MVAPLKLRSLHDTEEDELRTLAHGQKVEARLRDRARICWLAHQGQRVAAISDAVGSGTATVRHWVHRFNTDGVAGLQDAPRIGRPPTYTAEEVGTVVEASLTKPTELGLPFGSWTLDRLVAYLQETHDITMRRSRIGELLQAEGLRWRTQETWFGERPDPAFAEKRGPSSRSPPSHRRTVS